VQYSAAGPSALLLELERSFRRDLAELEESLRDLPIRSGSGQTSLELLTSTDQLLARAASCVDVASAELWAVTGPWAEPMQARFPAAIGRRVQLKVVSLGEPAPEGAQSRPVPSAQLEAYWGGLPLAVVADRTRAVFGVVMSDGTASGVATSAAGAIPFVRHLLRREFAGA
jgi:sugar-specific transcriptional regulator TrmB